VFPKAWRLHGSEVFLTVRERTQLCTAFLSSSDTKGLGLGKWPQQLPHELKDPKRKEKLTRCYMVPAPMNYSEVGVIISTTAKLTSSFVFLTKLTFTFLSTHKNCLK
jgi:hypothetical protein